MPPERAGRVCIHAAPRSLHLKTLGSRIADAGFCVIPVLWLLAAAAVQGSVVVVVPALGAPEQAELVYSELQARGLVPVSAPRRAGIDGVVVDVEGGDPDRARSLLQSAQVLYRELEIAAAQSMGRKALTEALRLQRPEDHPELLVDVLLFLAAIRLSINAIDDDGSRFLRLASRLAPTRLALDAGQYTPSAVIAWSAARSRNAEAEKAVVVVAPRVFGRDKDVVDVVVDGVLARPEGGLLALKQGPHLFTLRAAGCQSVSTIVDVRAADTPPSYDILAPAGEQAERRVAADAVRAGGVGALAALAQVMGADVVVSLSPAGRGQAWAGGDVVDVDADPADPAAFASAVLQALQPPPTQPPSAPASFVNTKDEPLWALGVGAAVVVVVVAAAGGLVTLLLWPADAPPSPPRLVPVTCCN